MVIEMLGAVEGVEKGGCNAGCKRGSAVDSAEKLLHTAEEALRVGGRDTIEHHIARCESTAEELASSFARDIIHRLLITQDIVSQRRTAEEELIELIEDGKRRVIAIAQYFLEDNSPFEVDFRLRERGIHDEVGDQFESTILITGGSIGI